MAENVPPKSTTGDDPTRGLPYYEKLRKDLRETLQKKRLLDKNISAIEDQIYRFESSYLEETTAGNIIKGFDNYIKGSSTAPSATTTGTGTSTRRKGNLIENDRIFSRSSASFMKELSPGASESGRDTPRTDDAGGNTSGTGAGNNKKKKKSSAAAASKDDDDDTDKAPKRLKITYARGGAGD